MSINRWIVTLAALATAALAAESRAEALCQTEEIHAHGKDRGFASSIAGSGAWFVAGAYQDKENGRNAGAAYVFTWNGAQWVRVAKLLPDDGEADAHFGRSVAISGNRIVVGAPYDDANGEDSGAAYVFEWDGLEWRQQARLVPDDVRRHDLFGQVAMEGDRIVVGAPGYSSEIGAAYVFDWDGAAWTQVAKLTPDEPGEGDQFGASPALFGDRVVVGAWRDDDAGADYGSAYVFVKNAGQWVREAKLLPDEPGVAYFGGLTTISGDRVVVTANLQDSGWVHVFRLSDGEWTRETKLALEDGGVSDSFGGALAFSGDKIVVGDPSKNTAYVYGLRDDEWIMQDELYTHDLPSGHYFGRSVCADDERIIIGAPGNRRDHVKGWAYVFEYACDAPENETCDARIRLEFPSVTAGTTKGATIDVLEECAQGAAVIAPSVWYLVKGTGGWMQADTCAGARFNTKISVYKGSCDGLECVTGNNNACDTLSIAQWESERHADYFIVVHGTLDQSGEFTLTLSEPPGEFDCNRITRLGAKCAGSGGQSRTVKTKLTSDLPRGTRLNFTLDGDRVAEARVNNHGKAKAEFVDVGPYEHQVGVQECSWVTETLDCGSEGSPDLVWITQGHSRSEDVAFSPDGAMLATTGGTQDGTVKLWSVSDGSLLRTLAGHNIAARCVAFSPDGEFLASGGNDHVVKLWRVSDGSLVWAVSVHGTANWIYSVAFSPDGSLIAAGGRDDFLTVLRVSDGSFAFDMEGHYSVYGTAFSPDGEFLAFIAYGLNLYRVSDWTLVRRIDGADSPSVAFSPDGALIAAASNNDTVNLWRVSDGSLVQTMIGHTDNVETIAFSPDGAVLGTGSRDKTIRLWNVEDGTPLRMYDQQTGVWVYGLQFSPVEDLFGYVTFDGLVAVARNPF